MEITSHVTTNFGMTHVIPKTITRTRTLKGGGFGLTVPQWPKEENEMPEGNSTIAPQIPSLLSLTMVHFVTYWLSAAKKTSVPLASAACCSPLSQQTSSS